VTVLPSGKTRLELPGYQQSERPGAPRLPQAAVLVALPAGAEPVLEFSQLEEQIQPLPAPVETAARPQGVVNGPDGRPMGGAFVPAEGALFQPAVVELERLGSLRGIELARLVFYPARPEGSVLRVTTHVQVFLHFNAASPVQERPASRLEGPGDPLLAAIQEAVANPGQAIPAVTPLAPARPDALHAAEGSLAAVEVGQTGLTEISFESLAGAGLSAGSLNPHTLLLSRDGKPIPTEWDGDNDEQFEAGERILFYAALRFSRYSRTDVYYLSQGSAPGLAMESRPADPQGLPVGAARVDLAAEKNLIYTPDCYCAPLPAGRDGDRWVWQALQRPDLAEASFPFDLPDLDPGQPASVTVWMIGYTDIEGMQDHRVNVALNGTNLGSLDWDGKQAVEQTFTIPGAALKTGENTLDLALPGVAGVSVEGAWLDAFTIHYGRLATAASGEAASFRGGASRQAYTLRLESEAGRRAYDVSDPDGPVKLEGITTAPGGILTLGDPAGGGERTYWVTTENGIISPAGVRPVPPLSTAQETGADYLLIAPDAFLPALADLIALRQSQGLKVAVERPQAVYHAYGDGRTDPEAIRRFLADAYTRWSPRPAYVLLVGDGTADPKQYHPASSETILPPYLADVDPWAGETAADNRFVMLEGEDNLPEMLIGRLPVNNLLETQAVVQKLVQYELEPAAGRWNTKVVFVADDPDEGGNFPGASELSAASLPLPFSPERQYYTPPAVTASSIRQGLLAAWQAGAGLLMYTGHASIHQWAVERFLHIDDVPGLQNGSLQPILLEMTCFTGSFQVPGFATLDETLLRQPQAGVAAAWGSTGLGIVTGHESLAAGFLGTLTQASPARLGDAALAGKLRLAAEKPVFLELVDTYTLLGDPATRFHRESRDGQIYFPHIYSP
jgi:hypothetical protein